jgi:hypothetical protein
MKQRLYEDDASDALNSWNETASGPDFTDKKGTVPGEDGGNNTKKPKTPNKGGDNKITTPGKTAACVSSVQNLLKELNPSFNVSGSMDSNTLIEIMNKLNELEKLSTVTKNDVAVIEKPKYFPSIDITEP